MDMCTRVHGHVRGYVCEQLYADISIHNCMDMCDSCMDMCIDVCIDSCIDSCVDMCMHVAWTCLHSDGATD